MDGSDTVVANATASTTALSSYSVYVDNIAMADFSQALFDTWLLPIDTDNLNEGYVPLALNVNFSTAGPRCVALYVITLLSALPSSYASGVSVTAADTFAHVSWTTGLPSALAEVTIELNVSTLGVEGTALSSNTSLLYLAGVVYNCSSSQPVDAIWTGSVDVSSMLSSGALTLYSLAVSEQVDHISTLSLSQPVGINVYQTTFSLSFAVSLASAADVFVALISLPQGSSPAVQWASGYVSINMSLPLSSITVTLAYQQTPSTGDAEFELEFAVLPFATADSSTTWGSFTARYTAAPVNASLYAVQDLVDLANAPTTLAPANDSPRVNLTLSTAAARTTILALVDTASWPAGLTQQCAGMGSMTTANVTLSALQTTATSPCTHRALYDSRRSHDAVRLRHTRNQR